MTGRGNAYRMKGETHRRLICVRRWDDEKEISTAVCDSPKPQHCIEQLNETEAENARNTWS